MVKLTEEGGADAGAFFVDRVREGVGDVVDAVLHLRGEFTRTKPEVYLGEFFAVVGQLLEVEPFRMLEEEEIDGLDEGFHLDLHVVEGR